MNALENANKTGDYTDFWNNAGNYGAGQSLFDPMWSLNEVVDNVKNYCAGTIDPSGFINDIYFAYQCHVVSRGDYESYTRELEFIMQSLEQTLLSVGVNPLGDSVSSTGISSSNHSSNSNPGYYTQPQTHQVPSGSSRTYSNPIDNKKRNHDEDLKMLQDVISQWQQDAQNLIDVKPFGQELLFLYKMNVIDTDNYDLFLADFEGCYNSLCATLKEIGIEL